MPMAFNYRKTNSASPPAHWLWGHSKMIFNDPLQFTADSALKYKPLCRLRFGTKNIYVTASAESVQHVFLTHIDHFKKGPNYKRLSLLAGNGLIMSEGDFWKRQRRLAQPGFHREKIKGFLQTFIDCSYDMAGKWDSYREEDLHKISEEMSELTLKIIGKTLFGIDLYSESTSVPPDVKKVLLFLNKRNYAFPRFPLNWPLAAHKDYFQRKRRLDEVVFKIIDERVKGITQGDDILQMFLDSVDAETGEKMARDHIRDEIMTMFLAGFETSSVALTWVWYVLSQNDEVQKKFRDELRRVTGNDKVRPEHIMKLTYTMQLVEETLRLYPPVFTIPRQVAKDIRMHGHLLRKGSVLLTSIIALHRNPDYWENPEQFDPERFSPENREKIIKNAYIPFGTGQRICIGNQFALLEMVTALAVLGKRFFLIPKTSYVPKMIPAITTNVSEGMPMHIMRTSEVPVLDF